MQSSEKTLSKIEKLRRQKEIIENRIQQAEARRKSSEKKKNTRRKILLGAYFLDKFNQDGIPESVKHELDKFLTRSNDRSLFGFSTSRDEAFSSEENVREKENA